LIEGEGEDFKTGLEDGDRSFLIMSLKRSSPQMKYSSIDWKGLSVFR
jgi:hypothetical protein